MMHIPVAFLAFSSAALAVLPGNWPPTFISVQPVAEWTALYRGWESAPLLPIIEDCPNTADWAITVDDGPTDQTLRVLDILKKKGAKATFFVVGSRVIQNPEIVKRAVAEGHQIGIHTWNHDSLPSLSTEQIIADVIWTVKAVKEATGVSPKFLRPPYGEWDTRVQQITSAMGIHLVMWNRDTNDWKISEDPSIASSVLENVRKWSNEPRDIGIISLQHDLFKVVVDFAEPIIASISSNKQNNLVTVAQCMGLNPYGDSVVVTTVSSTVPVTTTVAPVTTTVPVTSIVPVTTTVPVSSSVPVTTTVPVTSSIPVTTTAPVTSSVPVTTTIPVTSSVPLSTVSKTSPASSSVPITTAPASTSVPITPSITASQTVPLTTSLPVSPSGTPSSPVTPSASVSGTTPLVTSSPVVSTTGQVTSSTPSASVPISTASGTATYSATTSGKIVPTVPVTTSKLGPTETYSKTTQGYTTTPVIVHPTTDVPHPTATTSKEPCDSSTTSGSGDHLVETSTTSYVDDSVPTDCPDHDHDHHDHQGHEDDHDHHENEHGHEHHDDDHENDHVHHEHEHPKDHHKHKDDHRHPGKEHKDDQGPSYYEEHFGKKYDPSSVLPSHFATPTPTPSFPGYKTPTPTPTNFPFGNSQSDSSQLSAGLFGLLLVLLF